MTQTPNRQPDDIPPVGGDELGGFFGDLNRGRGGGIIGFMIRNAAAGATTALPKESIYREVPVVEPSPTSQSGQLMRAERASQQPFDLYTRTVLRLPVKAPFFGEFTVRRTYNGPVSVLSALAEDNVGLLVFTTIANQAEEATIAIGKAHEGTDPTLGRSLVPDAGLVGDYLLSIKRYGTVQYRYLHDKDIDGMMLTPGGTIDFSHNPDRKTGQFKVVGGDRIAAGIEGYE